ncbi:iron complex transport system substrate-binding protein [Anaerobacterium chartisolvens]|uniref:Iron complex transport system substrate-binding protein n=1 Tax=Anaerobacterium chartisolvens TaxID=1297424 RepID=A0A369BEZ7_9FIRM|nr:ABC transporter substrate-binding protein [Anaerobacterium chartisolvens]RCX20109.1 iron complex transport system substrate-binding protein [Anaerobacterium chartisolvens]
MLKKRLLLFILGVVMALSFIGCSDTDILNDSTGEKSNGTVTNSFPITVTDSYDRRIEITAEPQRVISIAPNITEIVFSLDRSEKLVGRSEYCDFPEEAADIASIGSLTEPSIERIAELKPDLVIASTHFAKETVQTLEELGIKVAVFYGEESFEGVYDTIRKVGTVLDAKENAEKLVSEMKIKVQNVLDKVADKPKPSVYYVVSFGKTGDYTAGGDTFIGNMLEMAGGRNTADDVTGWAYSLEKLIEQKPEIIICSKYYNSKQGIENTNGYKELEAVKAGRLYEIDNNLLDRQGPRLAQGLEELARIIHSEVFK